MPAQLARRRVGEENSPAPIRLVGLVSPLGARRTSTACRENGGGERPLSCSPALTPQAAAAHRPDGAGAHPAQSDRGRKRNILKIAKDG